MEAHWCQGHAPITGRCRWAEHGPPLAECRLCQACCRALPGSLLWALSARSPSRFHTHAHTHCSPCSFAHSFIHSFTHSFKYLLSTCTSLPFSQGPGLSREHRESLHCGAPVGDKIHTQGDFRVGVSATKQKYNKDHSGDGHPAVQMCFLPLSFYASAWLKQ